MCLTGCKRPSSPSADAGASAPACGHATQSCPCCAIVTIKELSFTGNNVIEKDTTGNFSSPEWLEGRAQTDQRPVSYARIRKISFTAKFRVTNSACLATEPIKVKGAATFGTTLLEWTGSFIVSPGDTEKTVSLTSNMSLPNKVCVFDSTDITWQMNPCNMGWRAAGTTRNIVYVTLGDPFGSPNYWTLLDLSCRAAAAVSTETDFVTASFTPFKSKIGDGKGFRRKRDGVELTYYKFGIKTPGKNVFSCADLLRRSDGTGRCGAWANFLVAMHQIHGVTSSKVIGVVPAVKAEYLIVKNCTFSRTGSLPAPFTHAGKSECVKKNGIKGQGKTNPQFIFGDHALVQHSTGIYDPSYGVGPKSDLKTWESGAIAGIGDKPHKVFSFGGESHAIPAKCSPGFIVYTAFLGDTLSSIAKKFGIVSGTALYNHPYNAVYRAAHPFPMVIQPGETIYIPRAISNVAILKKKP